MTLHQVVLNEMTGPIPYELTLGEIIRDGDVSNPYQTFVLSLLSNYFSSYIGLVDEGPLPFSSDATSVGAIEAIKSLTPSDKVKLAQHLLNLLQVGQVATHDVPASSIDWIHYVLQRNQD